MKDLVKEYDGLARQRRELERVVAVGDDADPATQAAVSQVSGITNAMYALSDRMATIRSGTPSAPYVTNTAAWTDLALKDILREAAENGYDKVVWTPGAEQAKRYSLANQVDELLYVKNDNGTYGVVPYKDGEPLHRIQRDNIPEKNLESLFGREVAAKMRGYEGDVSGNARSLSGQNLAVGGEGMKGYYDKIVPTQLSKLLKKLDPEAKIGQDAIGSGKYEVVLPNGKVIIEYPEKVSADIIARKYPGATVRQNSLEVPSITITPKMRENIMKGQAAFSEGGEVNFKKMFEGDSEAMQERARELAREAYSKGYGSLGKKRADEWETLARKYNLPLSVGPFDNYEDQYSNALSGWQRNVSPKQRVQTYDEGGPVKADLAAEELTNLQKILAGSNPAANVAPFQLDLGGGSQARGRVVQAGPYIDIGGGITLPLRDVMLMLDASYGKVPGTDMKPNISVKGGLRIPFAEGGAVTPYNADEIAALANQIYEGTNG